MKSVKVYLYVSARPEPNDPQYVCVSHMKIRWGRHRQNTHLPNSPAGCIEIRPDLDCFSVQDNRSARRWMNKHEQREWQRGRQMQLAVVQIKAARAAAQTAQLCVRGVNMTFLAARSAGCPRTMDTGHRTVQRRVRRIETRGTENRRGEGGWQAFSKLRKREVKIYWHTHTTRSHTLIQIPLSAMKTCLQTLLCVSVCKFWIRLSAMKTCLQTVKCVTVEVLNNVSWLMNVWECTKV